MRQVLCCVLLLCSVVVFCCCVLLLCSVFVGVDFPPLKCFFWGYYFYFFDHHVFERIKCLYQNNDILDLQCLFIDLFIYLFIYAFVQSCVYAFINSFIH